MRRARDVWPNDRVRLRVRDRRGRVLADFGHGTVVGTTQGFAMVRVPNSDTHELLAFSYLEPVR